MSEQDNEKERALNIRQKRALYRAEHRGTRELDFLLGRYARNHVHKMAGAELDLFEELLQLPEPQVERMIVTPDKMDGGGFSTIIDKVRRFHGLEAQES